MTVNRRALLTGMGGAVLTCTPAVVSAAACDVAQAACELARRRAGQDAFADALAPTDHAKMACLRIAVYGRTEMVLYKGPYRRNGDVPSSAILTSQRPTAGDYVQYRGTPYPIASLCFTRGMIAGYLDSIPANRRRRAKMTLCNGLTVDDGFHHELSYEVLVDLMTTGHAGDYARLLRDRDATRAARHYSSALYRRRHMS